MIHNEREYKITKKSLEQLKVSYLSDSHEDVPDWVLEASKNALGSQIEELEESVREYELLKSGQDLIWECFDLEDLPILLIKARIASGLTQKQLAEIICLKPQQIQRYESESYKGANLKRLIDIANAVGVSVSGILHKSNEPAIEEANLLAERNLEWERFPAKEMASRGWISAVSKESIEQYILDYLGGHTGLALHRKKVFGKNKPDFYSLVAWQARVFEKARNYIAHHEVDEFVFDDSWIDEFVLLSRSEDSPKMAKEFLARKGILLIVEKHLEKTYLDGAAMLSPDNVPVIALTLRHDRLDNFWFVVMHELGHIFKHMYQHLKFDFFDESDGGDGDAIEREADEFAMQNLIPNKVWDLCVTKYSATEESVLVDSKRLGISPAIIAGRFRKETGKYYSLTGLVGNGQVRKSLEEVLV